MKISKIFIFVLCACFAIGFFMNVMAPKKFRWEPTFLSSDEEPFGCFVFDSIMHESMPNGYQVSNKTLYQLDKEKDNRNILILANQRFKKVDLKSLVSLARKGNRIILSGGYYSRDSLTQKYLHVDFDFGDLDIVNFKNKVTVADKDSNYLYTNLFWKDKTDIYSDYKYRIYAQLLSSVLVVDSLAKVDTLAYQYVRTSEGFGKEKDPEIVSEKFGKGEIIFCSGPLLFTNYSILSPRSQLLVMRLMSLISDKPVVRTQAYEKSYLAREADASPLREFLKRPALRWALYTLIIGVLLLIGFTARRRQRIIPVVEEPTNKSLEFIKLIGTLYYQNKDNTDIVKKKYSYFTEEIRRVTGIDIDDVSHRDEAVFLLANKTGIPEHELDQILKDLLFVCNLDNYNISNEEMRRNIDNMNRIIKEI